MKLSVKLTAVIFSTLLSSPAIAAGNGSSPNGKPFVAINDQIIEAKGAISSIEDQLDGLIGQVDSIDARLSASELAVDNLYLENDMLQAMVDQNATDIGAIETGSLARDADLQGQIDTNLGLIQALQAEIGRINNELQYKQNLVNGCPTGYAIRDVRDDGGVYCTNIEASSTNVSFARRIYNRSFENYGGVDTEHVACPSGYRAISGGYRFMDRGNHILDADVVHSEYVYDAGQNRSYLINEGFYVVLNKTTYGTDMVSLSVECMKVN